MSHWGSNPLPSATFLHNVPHARASNRSLTLSVKQGPHGTAGSIPAARTNFKRYHACMEAKEKLCETCHLVIPVKAGERTHDVARRRFCNRKCYGASRMRAKIECGRCKKEFQPKHSKQEFCGRSCSSSNSMSKLTREERVRRGRLNSAGARENRYKQIALEESMAESLRAEGWEVFSPTVVCDRVAVKDGKVFFIEFKPASNQTLRPGQARIAELVPEMYKVVVK